MNNRIANIFSVVFQPLLMMSYLFGIVLFMAPSSIGPVLNSNVKFWLWVVVFLTTFVIPVLGLLMLKYSGTISSFQMRDRSERPVPFFLISFFYILTAYLMMSRLDLSISFNAIFISAAILVLLTSFTTLFWKISIHSSGVCGVLGFLVALNIEFPNSFSHWITIVWVILCGIIMTSRLYLNVHKTSEVYIGGLLGFLFSFLSIYIFV